MIIHPVNGRLESLIPQTLKEVANIDYERSFDRSGVQSLVLGQQHLQAAGVILQSRVKHLMSV
jgi:hypothetical protein